MQNVLQQEAKKLADLLIDNHLMMATAESCTGGLIAKTMTDFSGSSGYFSRGIVTYSNNAKQELLLVKQQTLETFGAVSEQVVSEMVTGLMAFEEVGVGVAISGIAGPTGGSEEKPVGTVWLAWQVRHHPVYTQCFHFNGDRQTIRLQGALEAIKGLICWLENSQLEPVSD